MMSSLIESNCFSSNLLKLSPLCSFNSIPNLFSSVSSVNKYSMKVFVYKIDSTIETEFWYW